MTHGAGANPLLIGESEQKALIVGDGLCLQALDLVGDRHFDAKLLRLVIGPCHQGQAGNAGRKTQIVLDARRRTGLTAERAAIQHEHRQTLGSRINRGRKTRRPGADDDHVINLVRVDRFDEPDATCEFDVAGIAQQLSVGTENDRQFASGDLKALDQRSRTWIGLWIEPLVRMPVAGEEPFEAKNIAVIGAADDHRPAGTHIEQPHTAQDQSAHDALAQLGLFDHQITQPRRRNDESVYRFRGKGVDQGRSVG